MAVETYGNDVWLTIDDTQASYVLHENPYALYFVRFEFVGGLDSPLALVVYRDDEKENRLRLDVQKRAFVVDFEEESKNSFFQKELAPALLGYLEAHSPELNTIYLSQLLKKQQHHKLTALKHYRTHSKSK